MSNDAYTQQALAMDAGFRRRVRSAMSSVAWEVTNEDPSTPNHSNRNNYANQVIRGLDNEVTIVLPNIVFRPNVMNFATSADYNFPTQTLQIVTAAGDPDLLSQISTDWDDLAAAAGFNAPPVTPTV